MIPLSQCKHSYLYRVSGCDFSLGIFDGKNDAFIGIVEGKYSSFLKMEHHFDVGAKYGKVIPLKELQRYPSDKLGLNINEEEVVTEEMLEENDDYSQFLTVGQKMYVENSAMLDWLKGESVNCTHTKSEKL